MGQKVWLKTTNRSGSLSVYHTRRLCSHLLMAKTVVSKDYDVVKDFLRECKRCSGEWEPYVGSHDSYVGQCRHCDGPLDDTGQCPFCTRYAEVIEA